MPRAQGRTARLVAMLLPFEMLAALEARRSRLCRESGMHVSLSAVMRDILRSELLLPRSEKKRDQKDRETGPTKQRRRRAA